MSVCLRTSPEPESPCQRCPARQTGFCRHLGDLDAAHLLAAVTRRVKAGSDVVSQGENCGSVYLLREGWAVAQGDAIALPLTQAHIGDALGLTAVHTNRMLARLRDDGIIALTNHTLSVLDPDRLAAVAFGETTIPRCRQIKRPSCTVIQVKTVDHRADRLASCQ